MSEIRIGIIGAGHIAKEHLKVIQALPRVKAVGITSRTKSKADLLAKEYAIDKVYETIQDLVENCSPSGLMVLVSANQIYEVVRILIPKGIPLFIEKPPGLFSAHTKNLVELAKKNGTKTMVGFNRRYYSIFRKGIELLKFRGGLKGIGIEGHERFWKISGRNLQDSVRENWIYVNSTHTLDLLRYFAGEIKSIHTVTNSLKEKNGDQFVASIKFESGVIGTYTSHWWSPGGWSVTLYGEGITIHYKPLEEGYWIDTDFKINVIDIDDIDVNYKSGFFAQLEAFCEMIRNDNLNWPGQDLFDSLKTMQLAQKFISG